MRARTRFTSFLIFFAVFFPAGTRAQSTPPQGQASVLVCRPWEKQSAYYKNGGVYIAPNESIVGDSICHVEAKSSAPAPAPAVTSPVTSMPPPQPTPTPVPTPPAPVVAPTPVPVRAEASPAARPIPADGKRRLFISDEPIDESFFIARNSSHASAQGQTNGSLNGSWNSAGGSVNGSMNGSYQGQANSSGMAYGSSVRGSNPRTIELDAEVFNRCGGNVVVTSDIQEADYILVFRRQDNKRASMFALGGLPGLALGATSKINGAALFAANSGDLVFASESRSVKAAIVQVCGRVR